MKKVLFILLLPIIILGLTGCGEKKDTRKTITLEDSAFGYATTFKYDENEKFTDIEAEKSGVSNSLTFKNEELDVEFQMYYTRMMKTSYETSKKARSAQKYYKEYKFGEFDAYAYGDYTSGIYLNILLGVDNTETAKVLFVSIDRIDTNQGVVVADVLDKKLNKFFNTIQVESLG